MNLEEYQSAAKRTMPDLGSKQLNIAHMIMGMNSEYNELYEATDDVNRAEELTDYLWYLVNYATLYNLDIFRITDICEDYYKIQKNDDYVEQLQISVSRLTDLEKKLLAYKKEFSREKLIDAIVEIIERLSDCYLYYNISPQDSMQKNIAKLKARFPDKFNEHDAKNRNLSVERQILEGNIGSVATNSNLNHHQSSSSTLIEHNEKPELNGKKCPYCNTEMYDTYPSTILTSNPAQKNVHCEKCNYKGYRFI